MYFFILRKVHLERFVQFMEKWIKYVKNDFMLDISS